jgi:pSer/pThr/pTyr-binding forkhead associated (FHA) protein
MRVTLCVIAGPHAGTEFSFDRHDTFLVGRSRHAHFQLREKDRYFSRIHFMMEVNPPHCRLIDIGSRNGTYLNGERVLSGILKDGDQIRAGHTVLRLGVRADSAEEAATVSHQPAHAPAALSGAVPRFPGYATEHVLSDDGIGPLYRARRLSDGSTVAIRTIVPSLRPTPAQLDDFFRSARFLLKLEHPCLARLCDLGYHSDRLWFVSEHADGADAQTIVKRDGPLQVRRAVRWADQVLRALKYAHALHFVHCDIKPANLIVEKESGGEVVKLADFGIARVYQSAPFSGLSITGNILTAAAFLPPEVLLNYQEAKPAADQYAVAATLYFLLAGTHALDLPAEIHHRFTSLLRQRVVPLRDRRPEVPAALADAIHKAMSRTPAQRYKNVVEFRHALVAAAR